MKNTISHPTYSRGYSLIELLVAVALSGILLAGVVKIFANTKNLTVLTQGYSEVQERARIALELFAKDIRNSDYWGCLKDPSLVTDNLEHNDADYDPSMSEMLSGRGITGVDEAADVLTQRLHSVGIACHIQTSDKPTIIKSRIISAHQQLLRMDFETPFTPADAAKLPAKCQPLFGQSKILVLSDYNKGTLSDPQPLIQAAKAAGLKVLVDPKGQDFGKYRGADLITPNMTEFEAVVGHCASETELVSKGEQLMHELELGALLVPRGDHGMTLLRPGEEEFHLPARARGVFDVTGAGDTVIAVLAAALASGEPLPQAVALANIAASIVVGQLGTAAVSAPALARRGRPEGQRRRPHCGHQLHQGW